MLAATRNPSWQDHSDEDLLKVRLCDLGVRIEGSEVEPRIWQLYGELEDRAIFLRPRCYISDEWQSPGGQSAVGIPFYLAHPRLKALEFRMMFDVEGGTANSCMKLLRHEAAHAIDHAYRLNQRREWQEVFGSPRRRYDPYAYMADPRSKSHVRNLPDNYAQCHPEEDFAETFAVWLNPSSQWRTRYKGWPAMRKLRYVNGLMREVSELPVPRKKPVLHSETRNLRSTLETYYRRKIKRYKGADLSFAVRDLKTIFRVSRAARPDGAAAALIRKNKRHLVDSVATWSGLGTSEISRVVARLASLCEERGMVLREDPQQTLVRLSTYVAALVVNRVHTSSYRLNRR